jgi:hypothetical protein
VPGVRLYHPKLRSCMLTVEHPRKYMVPLMCGTCGHIHEQKTYHITVDSTGHTIVSEGVLARLREINLAGFTVANKVVSPPDIQIGFDAKGKLKIVRHAEGLVKQHLNNQ